MVGGTTTNGGADFVLLTTYADPAMGPSVTKRSLDGGDTATTLATSLGRVTFNPANPAQGFSTSGSITADAGATWTQMIFGTGITGASMLSFGTRWFALVLPSGAMTSGDGGQTWTALQGSSKATAIAGDGVNVLVLRLDQSVALFSGLQPSSIALPQELLGQKTQLLVSPGFSMTSGSVYLNVSGTIWRSTTGAGGPYLKGVGASGLASDPFDATGNRISSGFNYSVTGG